VNPVFKTVSNVLIVKNVKYARLATFFSQLTKLAKIHAPIPIILIPTVKVVKNALIIVLSASLILIVVYVSLIFLYNL